MHLFRSNFTFQVSAWSAWQRVNCQWILFLVLTKRPRILLSLYIDSGSHALGADGSVYVWGEGSFDPFHFTLKLTDIDNPL